MSNIGKAWMARVAQVPCVVCGAWPVEVHHCRTGAGLSQRSQDVLTVALCPEHHRGASGVHGLGRKGFYARYKRDEMDLLAATIEAIAKGMP
jgi:hypothetical protein